MNTILNNNDNETPVQLDDHAELTSWINNPSVRAQEAVVGTIVRSMATQRIGGNNKEFQRQ